ncbi:MAG TPA: hypothetical protein VJK25_03615 [Patescibacteria group bacterium]|nr:hypothetical protein [Patescibacteria group bacterium]
MRKITKVLHWFWRSITGGVILIILSGLVIAAFLGIRGWSHWRQVQAASLLVKEHLVYQPTDRFSGCLHPDNGVVIVSFNRDTFFGVKDGLVFIPLLTPWYNERAQALAPDLPVEEHNVNPYYLMEYCR